MGIFFFLADKLLSLQNHIFYSAQNGDFGFEYMANYSGLMAKAPKTGPNAGKIKRAKQGYFDVTIKTGTRYSGKVTHRQLFNDLVKYSSIDNCFRVWKGDDPKTIGSSTDEKETLIVLTLLMFEQEINWGNEAWQRSSNFSPFQRSPCRRRPRDMIMGFIRQAFDLGVDNIKYWYKTIPGTVCFSNPDDRFQSDYGTYPDEYKRYFTELETLDGTPAIMAEKYRDKFRQVAQSAPDNPKFK